MNRCRKGIILAGGAGSRLWPLTVVSTKQLLPIYDKPMIYYPLTTLMLAGIRNFLIITAESEVPRFEALLGDGNQWGITIGYAVQPQPAGLGEFVQQVAGGNSGATVFCHWVNNPSRYGVLDFNEEGLPIRIEEKPKQPRSNWAITGLYFYDASIV